MLRCAVLKWISNKNSKNNLNNILDSKQDDSQGFTLAEMLVTVIVAGVLAAVTIPSFVGLLNKNQVQESTDIIQTALKEVQKEAMAKSINCELRIDGAARTVQAFSFIINSTSNIVYPSTVPANCLTSSYSLGSNVSIYTNSTPTTQIRVRYSYKGNVTADTIGTEAVVVLSGTSSNEKKCVIVPNGVGIVRTGTYTGSNSTALASSCSSAN
jgi:prepilin-type N-terminal cleavage/methylation domain-containing protein